MFATRSLVLVLIALCPLPYCMYLSRFDRTSVSWSLLFLCFCFLRLMLAVLDAARCLSFSIFGFRVFAWILTAQCIAGVQSRWLFVGVGFARRKPVTLSSFVFER